MASLGGLGKCRLCLKIGEFYSIFTGVDDRTQLSGMAMACSAVKIYKGDGLPDKICGECIEKLSAAYIFKQQCERCDAELRQSLPSNNDIPEAVQLRKRKSHDVGNKSNLGQFTGDLLQERFSINVPNTLSTEATNADAVPPNKRQRLSDASVAHSLPNTPNENLFECSLCDKAFATYKGVNSHQRIHKKEGLQNNSNVILNADVSNEAESDVKSKNLKCEACNEEFQNKIVYNHHLKNCKSETNTGALCFSDIIKFLKRTSCPVCDSRFKRRITLKKHLEGRCGSDLQSRLRELKGDPTYSITSIQEIIREEAATTSNIVICSNCGAKFHTHSSMLHHFYRCLSGIGIVKLFCADCNLDFSCKEDFISHIKSRHILTDSPVVKSEKVKEDSFQCHKCDNVFSDQMSLVKHLAAHMANINITSKPFGKKTTKFPYKCWVCKKSFRFRQSLHIHVKVHKIYHALPTNGDKLNKCEICNKKFQYAKSLTIHMKNKHPIIEEPFPEEYNNLKMINFSKLPVRCTHCDLILNGKKETKIHNRWHMKNKMKPQNEYTCICSEKFTNTKTFYNHYKEHDFSNENEDAVIDASISNFCEVTSDLKRESDEDVNLNIAESNEDQTQYQDHLKSNNKNSEISGQLSCFVCNQNFTHGGPYKKHMRLHYYDKNINPNLIICKICNRPSKNMRSYIGHMSWHTAQGRFKCLKCHSTFPYFKLYAKHMLLGHNVNIKEATEYTKYCCRICNKYYTSEESLKYHHACHKNGEDSYINSCTHCTRKFSTKYRLLMHLQASHNTVTNEGSEFVGHQISKKVEFSKTYKCPVCAMVFKTYQGLGKHKKKHTILQADDKIAKKDESKIETKKKKTTLASAPLYPCVVCSRKFVDRSQLLIHLRGHERKPNLFQCTLCMKKAPSMRIHLIHLRSHLLMRNEIPLRCDHCDESFVRRQELKMHLRAAHNIVENYVQELDEDMSQKADLKKFQCHICHKILNNDIYYQKHILGHDKRRCNYCLKYFDSKEMLLTHMTNDCKHRNTLGIGDPFAKKLKCRICYKPFSILVKLNCHLKTQHNIDTPNTPFAVKATVCDFCFSVFDSEIRMNSHRKVHFPPISYQCKLCDKRIHPFTSKKHKARHMGETFENLKCEFCEETFIKVRNLTMHMDLVHQKTLEWYIVRENIVEQCPICKKEFSNLHRHMMYHEKYKCNKCSEYYFSEILFKEHICDVISEPEKEIQVSTEREIILPNEINQIYEECEFCFKPITSYYTKLRHEKNHNKLIYFGCRMCRRRFAGKSAFNHHAASHKSRDYTNNPLQCRHCGEKFARYILYFDHIQQKHNDPETLDYYPSFSPELCLICNKTFPNIYRHYKYHKDFQCRGCEKYILSHKQYLNHKCNDTNEDSSLVVAFNGDISELITPNYYMNYEAEKIPRMHINECTQVENNGDTMSSINAGDEGVSFDNFSPVISSTMSLSSTTVIGKETEDNGDISTFEIKNEPIDNYYKDYSAMEFQNSLLDMNHSG